MAIHAAHMDSTIFVINVYAPTDRSECEGLFDFLHRTLVFYEGRVVLGSDFNCKLNPHLDRSYTTTTGRHDSPALRRLLARVQMSDVLEDELQRIEDERSISEFYSAAHTYFYTLPGGGTASSRLDRWYVSSRNADWIRDVHQSFPGPEADHNGVTIILGSPSCTVRVCQPRRVYPVPDCAKDAAHRHVHIALDIARCVVAGACSSNSVGFRSAHNLAGWWDRWKTSLRKALLSLTENARQI